MNSQYIRCKSCEVIIEVKLSIAHQNSGIFQCPNCNSLYQLIEEVKHEDANTVESPDITSTNSNGRRNSKIFPAKSLVLRLGIGLVLISVIAYAAYHAVLYFKHKSEISSHTQVITANYRVWASDWINDQSESIGNNIEYLKSHRHDVSKHLDGLNRNSIIGAICSKINLPNCSSSDLWKQESLEPVILHYAQLVDSMRASKTRLIDFNPTVFEEQLQNDLLGYEAYLNHLAASDSSLVPNPRVLSIAKTNGSATHAQDILNADLKGNNTVRYSYLNMGQRMEFENDLVSFNHGLVATIITHDSTYLIRRNRYFKSFFEFNGFLRTSSITQTGTDSLPFLKNQRVNVIDAFYHAFDCSEGACKVAFFTREYDPTSITKFEYSPYIEDVSPIFSHVGRDYIPTTIDSLISQEFRLYIVPRYLDHDEGTDIIPVIIHAIPLN